MSVESTDRAVTAWHGGFTMMPNVILRDARLSVGARLAYSVLLSYAWDGAACFPGQQRLADDMGVTARQVRTYLQELKDAGLVSWERGGLQQPNRYTVHGPLPLKTGSTLPLSEEVHFRSRPEAHFRLKNTQENNTQKKKTQSLALDGFKEFYAAYPRRTARVDAERAWAKLRPDAALQAKIHAALAWQRDCEQWREGLKHIPYPASWLNGRRWEDEPPVATNGAARDLPPELARVLGSRGYEATP